MTKSKMYWRNRELKHIKNNIKSDKQVAKELRKKYKEMTENINVQIEQFYGRYALREGIAIEEARKRVNKADIEKYKRKAKKYVKTKDFSKRANEEMRLYNVTMRVNRMELLKKDLQLELLAMTSEEERLLYEHFYEGAIREYRHQSAILGATVNNNAKNIRKIINSSFYSAEWSDNLWANHEALRNELDKLLHRGIVQGKNPRELARDFRKAIDSSVYNSERLLRTETARVQTDVFIDSARQMDIEQYEWIAEPDACYECADLDGKIFDVDKIRIGTNGVPKHPHCRCALAMYVDREAWDEKLRARGL